jgi:hypothetical protein
MTMSSRWALVLLMGLLVLSTASHAATGPWVLKVEAGTSDYSKSTTTGDPIGFTEISLDGGKLFGIAAEYRLGPRTGVELSLSSVEFDADWRLVEIRPISFNPTVFGEVTIASDSGSFTLRPLAATFLFHPLHGDRLDFYVGPQLAWVDFQKDVSGLPDRDSEFAFGAKLGFDVALGNSPWSAGLAYRFLETQHQGVEHDPYKSLDLSLISAVLSYRVGIGRPGNVGN